MNKETTIREYILSQYPNEACGVISNDTFYPIKNISETPELSFKMDPIELLVHQKQYEIEYIVHSHTYTQDRKPLFDLHPCTPSQSDYVFQQMNKVPWLIYASEGENVTQPVILDPSNTQRELTGREFIFYINDCYSLVRDFYFQKLNILLEPHSTDWTWEPQYDDNNEPIPTTAATSNCYEKFFKDWGFEKVQMEEIKYGDVIIMSILGDCNHAGVYIGDSLLLHHITKRKSDTVLVGKMNSFIQFVLRFKK